MTSKGFVNQRHRQGQSLHFVTFCEDNARPLPMLKWGGHMMTLKF